MTRFDDSPVKTADLLGTLSEREREVLRLLAEGATNAQIAQSLGITFETAKWHVSEVLQKLQVPTREQAAAVYHQHRRRGPLWALFGLPQVAGVVLAVGVVGLGLVAALAVLVTRSSDERGGRTDAQARTEAAPTASDGGVAAAEPSATVVAVSLPHLALAGPDGFRGFVRELAAMEQEDLVGLISARISLMEVSCESLVLDVRENTDLYREGCAAGQQTTAGFLMGNWRSSGYYATRTEVQGWLANLVPSTLPAESDKFGDGAVAVRAVNIAPAADRFDMILQAIVERPNDFAGDGPLRVAFSVGWEFIDGDWRATSTLAAWVLGEEMLVPSGFGPVAFPNWEPLNR